MSADDSLAQKTGVVVFARVITTVLELATAIALVRLLSETQFAIVSFLLLLYETARYVATLGFPDSVFYFFERVAKEARAGFALQTILIMAATGLVAGLGMWTFTAAVPTYLSQWSTESIALTQSLLPLMAIVAILEVPTWPVANLMLAADHQRASSWYQLMNGVLTFLCLVGPALLGYPLEMAVYGLFVYSIIRFVVSFVWIWRILPAFEQMPDRKLRKEQVQFALPIGLSALVTRINRHADKFIVSYFLAEATVAQYTVGAQEIPIVRVIPFAVGSVLISKYVQYQLAEKRQEMLNLWFKGIEKVSLIVLPLTLFFIAAGYEFITLVFGANYEQAVLPFQIYSLTVLMRVTSYASILQAFGDTKGIMRMSVHLMFWKILLGILGTMYFGIIGTAASSVIAHYINWHAWLKRIGTHMDLPWYRVLPFAAYGRILGLSAALALLIYSLNFLVEMHSVTALALNLVLYITLFVSLGRLTNIVSSEDLARLRSFLRLQFLFKS